MKQSRECCCCYLWWTRTKEWEHWRNSPSFVCLYVMWMVAIMNVIVMLMMNVRYSHRSSIYKCWFEGSAIISSLIIILMSWLQFMVKESDCGDFFFVSSWSFFILVLNLLWIYFYIDGLKKIKWVIITDSWILSWFNKINEYQVDSNGETACPINCSLY